MPFLLGGGSPDVLLGRALVAAVVVDKGGRRAALRSRHDVVREALVQDLHIKLAQAYQVLFADLVPERGIFAVLDGK